MVGFDPIKCSSTKNFFLSVQILKICVIGYGMTEASPVISALRLDSLSQESAIGSIGKPLPNTEVKLIAVDDSKGTPLGPNELGELLVRGPQVMKGYYNRPEENVFLDGWLRTGDMMYYNKDEFLFVSDRLKELIKVKGFQVRKKLSKVRK